MKNQKGISLIVLIITIIVIIILSTAILVSVISNNPVEEANTARYESDVDSMQAVFTNTVAKIMAKNQGTVNVIPTKINTVTSGVKETTGEVSYTVTNAVNSINSNGTIYFSKGENTSTEFFTGKELPIYAAGETKWYVDEEGNISVDIAGEQYGNGETITLEGAGQTYHTMAPTTLSFRSTADLEEFIEVQINGETLSPSNYTLTEGSTIVTLSVEYLKTLEVGKYEITVVSETRAASVEFEVVAPEVNEYGFYYNQPYTGYVGDLGGKVTFFIREDGTEDVILVANNYTETVTYTVEGNNITTISSMGTLTGTVSTDGKEIYYNELGTTFVLGDESIVADNDYIYVYDSSLGGYSVTAIDKTKASYGAIKTGLNGYPTVKIADRAFQNNDNLVSVPVIPSNITIIGDYAFEGCGNLTHIVIPNSVRYIGNKTFEICTELTSIIISDNVNFIGYDAFFNCRKLTNITFEGTMNQWNNINLGDLWNGGVPATHVQCSDGTVEL